VFDLAVTLLEQQLLHLCGSEGTAVRLGLRRLTVNASGV
jgi:hypothetical protein